MASRTYTLTVTFKDGREPITVSQGLGNLMHDYLWGQQYGNMYQGVIMMQEEGKKPVEIWDSNQDDY